MIVGAPKILIRRLTSAQIKVLSTPVTLLAGVAGSLYWVSRVATHVHGGTVPYSGNGGSLDVGWPDGPTVFVSDAALAEATDYWVSQTAADHEGATLVGAPLVVYAAADPTDGNGTLDIIVEYRKVTV